MTRNSPLDSAPATSDAPSPVRSASDSALVVYYDGSCPLCSLEIGHYAGQSGAERLCFVDASAIGADLDACTGAHTGAALSQADAMRRFHVRRADGQLLSGAQAFVAIWETLPAWQPVARLAKLPGVLAALEVGYRAFLPLRPLMSRVAKLAGAKPAAASGRNDQRGPQTAPATPDAAVPGFLRLSALIDGAFHPAPGRGRIVLALACGVAVHSVFAAAVLAMMSAMWFGMSESLGRVPQPWALVSNAALLLQFPLGHSLLLTRRGQGWLARMVPGRHGPTLATTTYALVASVQLLALFALWTPSGIVWWRAEGAALWLVAMAYAASWLLLIKASYDAGAEVQSGALGWMSLLAGRRPVFPDMPTGGLFRFIRQPIYVAFALTLWTVPVWTPDQLVLAVCFTAYCLLAPRLKERRFAARYGARFTQYRAAVPYAVPRLTRPKDANAQRSDDI